MMAGAQAQDRRLLAKRHGYRSLKSVSDHAVSQGNGIRRKFGRAKDFPRGAQRGRRQRRRCVRKRSILRPKVAARLAFCPLVLQSYLMAKPALDLTKLTPEEKLELIDELWTSISPEEFPLTEEQSVELHRRLDRLDEDGPTGVSWDRVRAEMMPRS